MEQSVDDLGRALHPRAEVMANKQQDKGAVILVRVAKDQLHTVIARLREQLGTGASGYTHFFSGSQLVVVFRNAIFTVSVDPSSWGTLIAHGQARGIPKRDLSFYPRTREEARRAFDLAVDK